MVFRFGESGKVVMEILQVDQNSVDRYIYVSMVGKNQIYFVPVRVHCEKIIKVMRFFPKIIIHVNSFYVVDV